VHPRVATQAIASDHTSLQRWAPEPPRVPQPRTSPPCRGELRCCHESCGPGPHFLAELSSGAATCSLALDLTSLPRWALALPRVSWLPALPSREESFGAATYPTPQRAVDHRNKERPSCPRHASELACVQSTVTCYRGTCMACEHAATVQFNSVT
jgi:hypothetical protein